MLSNSIGFAFEYSIFVDACICKIIVRAYQFTVAQSASLHICVYNKEWIHHVWSLWTKIIGTPQMKILISQSKLAMKNSYDSSILFHVRIHSMEHIALICMTYWKTIIILSSTMEECQLPSSMKAMEWREWEWSRVLWLWTKPKFVIHIPINNKMECPLIFQVKGQTMCFNCTLKKKKLLTVKLHNMHAIPSYMVNANTVLSSISKMRAIK